MSCAEALPSTDELVSWGYVASQYDQYADIWKPEDKVPGVQPRHWDEEDIKIRYNGTQVRGWVQKTDRGDYAGYSLCPTQYPKWGKRYIPPDLAKRKMLCRFIDTATALPLGECYAKTHPMTRTQDREARTALLKYIGELGLMAGSEMGVDWAVPYICYCEGMLSPVGYRNPAAGNLLPNMEPVPDTLDYMLNPAVRVPLWELVYHDCTVSYWYWGDATNTFVDLWPVRNAFNALYATPPIYMILKHEQTYLDQRDRIVRTDRFLRPIFDAVGFAEMLDHEFLSDDRKLQATQFADGTRVVVNFSDEGRACGGVTIGPLSFAIFRAGQVRPGEPAVGLRPQPITLQPVTIRTPVRRSSDMQDGQDLSRIALKIRAPWMQDSVELRFPEVLVSSMGYHFLDHYRTTIEPLSELDPYPQWQRDEADRALHYECTTPEGLQFAARATPGLTEVALQFRVKNLADRPISYISANSCLNLQGSRLFAHKWDLAHLFLTFGGKYQSLANSTPTPQQMGRQPWLVILSREGAKTWTGPRDMGTSWVIDQIADDDNLMGATSTDTTHLIAYTWDQPPQALMTNCGFPCLHTGTSASPELQPGDVHIWHGKVYLMRNDPEALVARRRADAAIWAGGGTSPPR